MTDIKLSANGRKFMELVAGSGWSGVDLGLPGFEHFDDGIAEHSGCWGESMAEDFAAYSGLSKASSGGVMSNLIKLGLFLCEDQEDGKWWALTPLGVEVALEIRNELVAAATPAEPANTDETPAVEASKGLTRKQAVAALKGLGYTGPTSYLMPKLRGIVAEQIAAARQARGAE